MRFLICLLLIVTSGCGGFGGAKGTPYSGLNPIKKNTGQLYIYRPSHFVMGLAIPTLKINDEPALSIRNGSYTIYDLEPGRHEFHLKRNGNWVVDIKFEVDIKENERQFYRLSTELDSIFLIGPVATSTINGYLGRVTEEFAITEMQDILYTGSWP